MFLAKPLPRRETLLQAFEEKSEVEISGVEITGKQKAFVFQLLSLTSGTNTLFFFGKKIDGVVSGYIDYALQNGGITEEI